MLPSWAVFPQAVKAVRMGPAPFPSQGPHQTLSGPPVSYFTSFLSGQHVQQPQTRLPRDKDGRRGGGRSSLGQQQPQSHSPHREEPQPDHAPRAKAADLRISSGVQASKKELK